MILGGAIVRLVHAYFEHSILRGDSSHMRNACQPAYNRSNIVSLVSMGGYALDTWLATRKP
jgi:hypothetical protein